MTKINVNFKSNCESKKETKPIMNELDTDKCVKIEGPDSEKIYADPNLLDDMYRWSPCDINQDSISDSKDSREALKDMKIKEGKDVSSIIAGKKFKEQEDYKNACINKYENSPCPFFSHKAPNQIKEITREEFQNAEKVTEPIVADSNKRKYLPETKIDEKDGILKRKIEMKGEDTEKENYEYVNHPKHYNNYDMEVIDMMVKIFGIHATISFCKLNAFKYRMRAGTKPDETIEKDLEKEQWYLRKADELESLIF